METHRGVERCHNELENKDEISLRGLMCERQVGQQRSTPPQSIPAAGAPCPCFQEESSCARRPKPEGSV